ncbi:hypothetical protein FGIG_12434 [Fasciola gigantica]|uniref:Uncharacterized protein n=1 Tax=Fasciola gigantica TaxID=46835 RepID=A0A504Y5G5_FASGI|nr:hypothetical protein FGIG_12434 [Fasciola gigantica]
MSSTEFQPIPRLCDRYSPWIQQPVTETSPNTEASEKTNFVSSPAPMLPLVLELPPPPSCPPPPPKNNDPNTSLTHCSSSPELTVPPNATMPTGLDGSTDPVSRDQMTTNVLTPTKMRISESNPSRTSLSTNLANVNGHDNHHDHQFDDPRNNGISNECNGSNDLDSRSVA